MPTIGHTPSGLILATLLCACACTSHANFYLLMDGIPGDTTNPAHMGWIDGLTLTTDNTSNAPPVVEKGEPPPIENTTNFMVRIEKAIDSASPLLCDRIARGASVTNGMIELTRTVGNRQRFYQIKLHNITLHSLSTATTNCATTRPTEWLRLSCTKAEWTYVQYDPVRLNLAYGDFYTWLDWPSLEGGAINPDRDTDSDGIPDMIDKDIDNDGLPNEYEADYKLLPTVDDSLDDLDGDGFPNRDEYWAGTNPADSLSLFHISRLAIDESFVHVTWSSEKDRTYDVYTGSSPSGPFKYLKSFPGKESETSADFRQDEVGKFFRVTTPAIIP
ncbi:MAG: type VI secretion system tube protein Hcp [bacterium]